MATRRASILGLLTPYNGAYFVPFDVLATNDVWKHPVLVYPDQAADCGVYGALTVPKNYVGTAKIITVYGVLQTSGNAYIGFNYRAVGGDDTESLDQAGTQESVAASAAAAASAAWERKEHSLTLTSANLAVDDLLEFYHYRDNDNGSETLAGNFVIFDILLEYADA